MKILSFNQKETYAARPHSLERKLVKCQQNPKEEGIDSLNAFLSQTISIVALFTIENIQVHKEIFPTIIYILQLPPGKYLGLEKPKQNQRKKPIKQENNKCNNKASSSQCLIINCSKSPAAFATP